MSLIDLLANHDLAAQEDSEPGEEKDGVVGGEGREDGDESFGAGFEREDANGEVEEGGIWEDGEEWEQGMIPATNNLPPSGWEDGEEWEQEDEGEQEMLPATTNLSPIAATISRLRMSTLPVPRWTARRRPPWQSTCPGSKTRAARWATSFTCCGLSPPPHF